MKQSASDDTVEVKPPSYWIAVNMRAYRRARSMSQEELGAKLGWVKTVVSACEGGNSGAAKRKRKLGIDEVIAIAEILEVTLDDLLRPVPPCETCADQPPKGFTCNDCGRSGQQ